MTVRILPREYGVVVECNRCGAKEQTAMCGRKENRTWLKSKGWGRGSDRGTPYRAAEPAIPASVDPATGKKTRARAALPEIEGRPRTTAHDLCSPCLKLDREASAARRKLWLTTRDAARKARSAKKAA